MKIHHRYFDINSVSSDDEMEEKASYHMSTLGSIRQSITCTSVQAEEPDGSYMLESNLKTQLSRRNCFQH